MRNEMLRVCFTAGYVAVLSGIATPLWADDESWEKQTIVYKTVGDTRIEADVFRRNGTRVRPTVVWIHGGALINGDRNSVPRELADLCESRDYVLVSIDYRLAPEVKLPAIIEDIKDAFIWMHTRGPEQLHLDPNKILVAGGSAGGYLTLMSGICVQPCPKALLAYFGYGDVDGPWYTEPSTHCRKQPLVSQKEALRGVGKQVLTGSSGDTGKARGAYYLYLRQNGLWTKEVTGFDPRTEKAMLDPFCPVRNVTPQYPPTMLIHGTADTDVPYQESVDMANALKKAGVPHELVTVEGGGHGLGGGDRKAAQAHARALEFVVKQLE